MTESYVIRLFYNKRNNNRLILKHFGNQYTLIIYV